MIDINSMDQGQVYMLYQIFKNIESDLEQKGERSLEQNQKLANTKAQLLIIETWANNKMAENLHWTKEEILLKFGHQPTLIMEFHPGSAGYKLFGKEVVGNVEFSDEELTDALLNIQNKTERKASTIRFKRIPEMTEHEISTEDLFQLGGRR